MLVAARVHVAQPAGAHEEETCPLDYEGRVRLW